MLEVNGIKNKQEIWRHSPCESENKEAGESLLNIEEETRVGVRRGDYS